MNLLTYFAWRVARVVILIITMPIWLPVGLAIAFLAAIAAVIESWCEQTRRDWERKHRS